MRLTLVRHATLLVEIDGHRLLVDPMLDEAGTSEAINHCLESRAEVRTAVPEALVPEAGEALDL